MKPLQSLSSLIITAVASAAFLCTPDFSADAPQPVPDNSNSGLTVPAPQPSKTVWMSREAADVLKLVHANVNDEVVMAYIQNSRAGFSLSADEIVQLHTEGVSDKMINAMLSHRKQAPQVIVASQQPAQEVPQQQVIQPTQPPPMVAAQPQTTYVQSQPVYVPSTTYVYSEPYYSYDPFYWSSWWYPSVAFNFGFGGYYPRYYGHYGYSHYAHYAPHYYGGYRGSYVGGGYGGFHGGYHGGYVGGGSRGGFGVGVHWGGGGGHRR